MANSGNDGSSAPLLCQDLESSNPAFQQTGTVDWVAVGKSSVGFTVDALSRLSKCGVDALTIYAARGIFSMMQLGARGEERLDKALGEIRAASAFDNVLYFGFGVKHIIRIMRDSREGMSCIGICACLTEEFSTEISAKVLRDLLQLYSPPADLTPALRQWKALVETSQGSLAATEFPLILHQVTKIYMQDGETNRRYCAPSKDIAQVLKGLFDVSIGQLDRLYLTGGSECAWIAAVGYWLLDLCVEVQDVSGEVLYRLDGSLQLANNEARVVITYEAEPSKRFQLARKCFVIPNGRSLFYDNAHQEEKVVSLGRVDWSTCCVDTFGKPMKDLLSKHAPMTGTCLGSAARVLLALMGNKGDDVDPDARQTFRGTHPPATSIGYGRGFYLTARQLLPELGRNPNLLPSIENAIGYSYPEAQKKYSQDMNYLSKMCTCPSCNDGDQGSPRPQEKFCLTLLVETLCYLVVLMSGCCTHQDLTLRPTRSGIESLYWDRRALRPPAGDDNYESPLEGLSRWNFTSYLAPIKTLFVGRDYTLEEKTRGYYPAAVATAGLCFYLNTLCEVTSNPESACLVNIIPGGIQWNDFIYHQIQDDRDDTQPQASTSGYDSIPARPINTYDSFSNISSPATNLQVKLVVEEASIQQMTLVAKYRVSSPDRAGHFNIGVYSIWSQLNQALTLADCHNEVCGSLEGIPSVFVEGEGLINQELDLLSSQVPIIRVLTGQDLAVWVALSQKDMYWGEEGFERNQASLVNTLQGRQCVYCCVTNGLKYLDRLDSLCDQAEDEFIA
ncbi:unnamed protein product [Clonostachys solani]|uniref:Uncharacterized protein n=1 Tax=Clonostachys solani TaxID=160281 RepID=A0A9N9Z8T4_9HYPO|nr:unnamed protein product [Clonostachys solani]